MLTGHLLKSAALVVIGVSVVAAFVGLTTGSLWSDELFTAYFANPELSSFPEFLTRAAEDVHPPGYYLVVWLLVEASGLDFTLVARGFAALSGCLALWLVYRAPLAPVSTTARLVACGFAASSWIWYFHTQEARSYALCFVIVALITSQALRCRHPKASGGATKGRLAALTALSILGVSTHYYLVLFAGAVFAVLLISATTWRERVSTSLCGLLVLAFAMALVGWHQDQIVVDTQGTWFNAGLGFIYGNTKYGLLQLISDISRPVFITVLALCGGLVLVTGGLREMRPSAAIIRQVLVLAGIFILTYAFAIILTVAVRPVFSLRVFYVLAPVVWIGLAYAVHIVLESVGQRRGQRIFVSCVLAGALVVSGRSALVSRAVYKEPWKDSSEVVAALPGCVSATLPVVWMDQPYLSDDTPERFYGYYLPPDPERRWISVPADQVAESLSAPAFQALIARHSGEEMPCPILLWQVIVPSSISSDAIRARLQDSVGDGEVKIREISSHGGGARARLYLFDSQ